MTLNLRRFCTLLLVALFATATASQARVHRVNPGESIQAAIDEAEEGDTILVSPGTYQEDPNSLYGLHITTPGLRLIGKVDPELGEAGKVRVLYNGGAQETGIFAAPPGCGYRDSECDDILEEFYIRGFTIEGFPVNGLQTRWVHHFQFVKNESVNNLNNGIYPTLSAHGLVRKNVSYGSLDTAMWVAGGEDVRVVGNELYGSVIGFEITVANDIEVVDNEIYDNTVGMGLFHPNAAGNPPQAEMANWVIRNNQVYDNNRPNMAPPASFQAALPQGIGILMLGISDHVVEKNFVVENDYVGIGVLDWCTANTGTSNSCQAKPPITDPGANNNLIRKNLLSSNGEAAPPGPLDFLAADLTFFDIFNSSSGNCFTGNKPKNKITSISSDPSGLLPTDGC